MTEALNPPPGALISLNGQLRMFGFCGHCSAPFIGDDTHTLGVYIDDTTPNRYHWVEVALEHHPQPQSVFVGIAPGESKKRLASPVKGIPNISPPALIRLWEFLPWGMGVPWRDFLPVPKCGSGNGYILQMRWPGFYGKKPPSKVCRETQLAQAR